MRYRSIDHGPVSRGRQCAGNCSKCATSTSDRRIDFVTRPANPISWADEPILLRRYKKRRSLAPAKHFQAQKENAPPHHGAYVQEIQDNILQDKRAAML